jgi:hypothetical protein
MCHSLPLGDRLHLDAVTLPPADLLLTKLQIFELTDKDQRDLLSLLLDHEIGSLDGDDVNGSYVARLCAEDWGLWRTSTRNLDRLATVLDQYPLSGGERIVIAGRLNKLQEHISVRPKSLRWKARAVVGERLPWYNLPEEVADQ